MKMKCLYKSIVRGDIVKPGDVLDLTKEEADTDVVKKFFVPVEETSAAGKTAVEAPSPAPAGKGLVAGLTRDQAIMKLQQAGVKVKGNISNQALIDLYNQTFANLAEATAPAE